MQFEGSKEAMQQLESLFVELKQKERVELHAQVPDFITAETGYMLSIDWENDTVFYETRWCPNNAIIQKIAEHFNAGYIHFYEETGCQIYGETTYKNGVWVDIFLEGEDFDLYEFDEEKERWFFEGEYYESDYDISGILLERKKSTRII